MMKIAGFLLLLLGLSGALPAPTVPEVDPGSSVTSLALLGGIVLIIRGRHRK